MPLVKKPEMTQKKLAANRRNQNLCNGPVVDERRERVRTALQRFGFDAPAEEVAMRALGEDAAHFQELLEGLWEEYDPVGVSQEGVVIRLARATWLTNRTVRASSGAARTSWKIASTRRELSVVWCISGCILDDARVDTPVQPALSESQVAIDGGLGHLHQVRRFLGSATKKVAQFDELDLVGIERAQFVQCVVQVQQFRAADIDPQEIVAKRDAIMTATPHLCLAFTRVIDQDHTHYLGGEGVEMLTVFPGGLLLVQKPEVELVDQGRRLKHVGIALSANIGRGHLAKVGVDERHQFLKG